MIATERNLAIAGNAAIFVALATSLVIEGAFSATLLGYGLLATLLSLGIIIRRSFDELDFGKGRDGMIVLYGVFFASYSVIATLEWIHGDLFRDVEMAIKMIVFGYIVMFYVRGYSVRIPVLGASVGAIAGTLVVAYEYFVIGDLHPGAATHSIRFGMIVILFSAVALAGALFARLSVLERATAFTGSLAGLAGVFLSGSRGAAMCVPLLAVMVFVRLWRQSRRQAAFAAAAIAVIVTVLFVADIGRVNSRSSMFFGELSSLVSGQAPVDQSDADRAKMIALGIKLFQQNPWIGAGHSGWVSAIDLEMRSGDPNRMLFEPHDHPHNQYVNDLAKGGLLRGLTGLAIVLVPMLVFARRRPFANDENSVPALMGLMCATGFAVFCLTETVMGMALPAGVYALLICYFAVLGDAPAKRSPYAVETAG